ncbi:hypothetical protein B0H19DRAFT_1081470 [Mycena capillaripes]|nr:hypothetical protein B0H19DRAFT_1081470 [Mycena capillaripes]
MYPVANSAVRKKDRVKHMMHVKDSAPVLDAFEEAGSWGGPGPQVGEVLGAWVERRMASTLGLGRVDVSIRHACQRINPIKTTCGQDEGELTAVIHTMLPSLLAEGDLLAVNLDEGKLTRKTQYSTHPAPTICKKNVVTSLHAKTLTIREGRIMRQRNYRIVKRHSESVAGNKQGWWRNEAVRVRRVKPAALTLGRKNEVGRTRGLVAIAHSKRQRKHQQTSWRGRDQVLEVNQ